MRCASACGRRLTHSAREPGEDGSGHVSVRGADEVDPWAVGGQALLRVAIGGSLPAPGPSPRRVGRGRPALSGACVGESCTTPLAAPDHELKAGRRTASRTAGMPNGGPARKTGSEARGWSRSHGGDTRLASASMRSSAGTSRPRRAMATVVPRWGPPRHSLAGTSRARRTMATVVPPRGRPRDSLADGPDEPGPTSDGHRWSLQGAVRAIRWPGGAATRHPPSTIADLLVGIFRPPRQGSSRRRPPSIGHGRRPPRRPWDLGAQLLGEGQPAVLGRGQGRPRPRPGRGPRRPGRRGRAATADSSASRRCRRSAASAMSRSASATSRRRVLADRGLARRRQRRSGRAGDRRPPGPIGGRGWTVRAAAPGTAPASRRRRRAASYSA